MNYQKIEERLSLIAQSEPSIVLDCSRINTFEGQSWSFIQSEMDSSRYVMRGMPTGLSKIKELLYPNRALVFSGLVLVVFILTALQFQSWLTLLFVPFVFIGGGLSSCLGGLMSLGSVALWFWSLYAGYDIVAICSGGLCCGSVLGGRMASNNGMFKALRESEIIFSFCFTMGWFWVEDQATGNDYRFYPGTGSWGL